MARIIKYLYSNHVKNYIKIRLGKNENLSCYANNVAQNYHESHAMITIKSYTNMKFTFSSSVQLLNCEE